VNPPPIPSDVRRRSAKRPRRRLFSQAVSRFTSGPAPAAPPIDEEQLFTALRARRGAVAPADVMRATGLDRAGAEALLCRALARHGGQIEVVDGAVVYRLRPLPWATGTPLTPIWERPLTVPMTGNRRRTDLVLALLNLLLLVASSAALGELVGASGWWGMALAPLGISLLGFLLPLARLAGRRAEQRRIAREAGRRRLLRAVIERPAGAALQAYWLSHAWIQAAGHAIAPAALTDEMQALGGEADLDGDARLLFRFPDLDYEARALAAERRQPRRKSQ
jgi:hypothetical protein